MPEIWTDRKELHAAFITREIEKSGARFESVTDPGHSGGALRALENNRSIISGYFDRPDLTLCMAKQVHGPQVLYTDKPGLAGEADGLVTDRPGLAVGVLVADCAALLLADPVNKVVAAVHAGWRGAIAGIIPEAVRQMENIGAEPDLIQAYVSPCISLEAFEVGEEVASRFPERFVDRTGHKPHVDLQEFIYEEILKNGISGPSVIRDTACTFRNEMLLHSHRRDGFRSGRMLGTVFVTE